MFVMFLGPGRLLADLFKSHSLLEAEILLLQQ
jgi:hypothetical protein